MAIIIPSKHIYSKKNNKIADNTIKKIEVNATEIKFDNKKNTTAYSETIKDYTTIDKSGTAQDFKMEIIGSYYNVVAVKTYNPKFVEKTITIPKNFIDKYIKNLYDGKDKDGENNITVSVLAQLYSGVATGNVNENNSSIYNVQISNTEKLDSGYIIPSSFEYQYTLSNDNILTANASSIDTSNNGTQKIRSDDNNYYIDLSILVGFEKIGLYGQELFNQLSGTGYPIVNAQGIYEKYEFIQADVSFNGEIISIVTSEYSTYYGDSKSKASLSFPNNELMQISNYASNGIGLIESNANKTIEQYSKGKETVVLKCDIGDYYDNSNNPILYVPKSINDIRILDTVSIYAKKGIELGNFDIVYNGVSNLLINSSFTDLGDGNIKIDNVYITADSNGNANISIYNNKLDDDRYYINIISEKPLPYDVYFRVHIYADTGYVYTDKETTMVVKLPANQIQTVIWTPINIVLSHKLIFDILEKYVRCIFQEGDIVIPMIRNSKGLDVPMSIKENGSAKQFEVLCTHIYTQGAVWQELKLQEII